MTNPERLSRRVAHALRHDPAVPMQRGGWVTVTSLLRHVGITRDELDTVIAASTRFELDLHGTRIRATHGHSVGVDLALTPSTPPAALWHGTSWRTVTLIMRDGLQPMRRRYVHLHADAEDAARIGPALLQVDTAGMVARGHLFYPTASGVWLVDAVPAEFLSPVAKTS